MSLEAEQDSQEGDVESLINEALKPNGVFGGNQLARPRDFGVSVVAQLGVWIHQSWVTQDWTALGVAAAGGLIVVAGLGRLLANGGGCIV